MTTVEYEILLGDILRDVFREEIRSTHMPRYLGTKSASRIAEVHPATIRTWVKRGDLRAFWAGNDLRIKLEDLEAYLSRRNPENSIDVGATVEQLMAPQHGAGRRGR